MKTKIMLKDLMKKEKEVKRKEGKGIEEKHNKQYQLESIRREKKALMEEMKPKEVIEIEETFDRDKPERKPKRPFGESEDFPFIRKLVFNWGKSIIAVEKSLFGYTPKVINIFNSGGKEVRVLEEGEHKVRNRSKGEAIVIAKSKFRELKGKANKVIYPRNQRELREKFEGLPKSKISI